MKKGKKCHRGDSNLGQPERSVPGVRELSVDLLVSGSRATSVGCLVVVGTGCGSLGALYRADRAHHCCSSWGPGASPWPILWSTVPDFTVRCRWAVDNSRHGGGGRGCIWRWRGSYVETTNGELYHVRLAQVLSGLPGSVVRFTGAPTHFPDGRESGSAHMPSEAHISTVRGPFSGDTQSVQN